MTMIGLQVWLFAGAIAHVAGAVVSVAVAAWLFRRRERFSPAGGAIVAALSLTALWSLTVAATRDSGFAAETAEAARNLAWLYVVYRLFASDGRHDSLTPIRPLVIVLAIVELLHVNIIIIAGDIPAGSHAGMVVFDLIVLFRLLMTVGALVLVHNLYGGASGQSRAALRWPAAGLAVLWVFDLNLYTLAYLTNGWPIEIAALRGLSVVALACLLAIGATRNRDALRFRPSRAVTFQTFSLLLIGIYLVAMVTVAQWLTYLGGDFAQLMKLVLFTAATVFAIFVLPSTRLRGWLKVTVAKHLFQHRYDYRAEWLRFTRTIGNIGEEDVPLGQRVVQAVADVAESPGGLLLVPGDHGDLTLAARWQWPEIDVPAAAFPARLLPLFEREGFIADLDDLRAGGNKSGGTIEVADWLQDDSRAWALVPLIHYDKLVGMVVLARPPLARRFDWEDFDLLRVVGRQLASYLAEHAGQEALAEAARFDDFHRRIAFVMHDIKNLASQLGLLARNAEKHADKPAFRDDMLLTLRNSAEKLNALLARLSRYGGSAVEHLSEVDAAEVARIVVDRFRGGAIVMMAECHDCLVTANRDSLEQVLVHLIQNGIDASSAESPVFLSVTSDGVQASFEIVDSGCGMSPEFVRKQLFKPFVSSKPGGFGIGAFEARELVRAMRGRLEVESREGLGSRFIVRLPLATTTTLYRNLAPIDQREAS
jgi:putative PEP-CTERM system histidine kinase